MNTTPFKVIIYMVDGRKFWYEVKNADKVREHAHQIIQNGYRHNDGVIFEHYPPWQILKVTSENIPTSYPDQVTGT